MFVYHEKSQCITVGADLSIRDIANRVGSLYLTLGYSPVDGDHLSLETCLLNRIPNRYFLRYGSVADLCVGWKAAFPNGEKFVVKPYPRAATGPDFRRFLIGIGDRGRFELEECTLKVFRVPAHETMLLYQFDDHPNVDTFIYWMIDHFIRPVGVWMGPASRLPLKHKVAAALSGTLLIIGLAGESKIVKEEERAMRAYLELRKGRVVELSNALDRAMMARILDGSHPLSRELVTAISPQLRPASEASSESWLAAEWKKVEEIYEANTTRHKVEA